MAGYGTPLGSPSGGIDQSKRISSLEDILRTNEMTMSNVLSRLKDVEVGLNQTTRQRDQAFNDSFAALAKEIQAMKARTEVLERSLHQCTAQLEERLSPRPNPSNDHIIYQTRSEIGELRQHLNDMATDVRKVDGMVVEGSRHTRQIEQDAKHVMDTFRDQINQHRDQLLQNQQKIEGVLRMVTLESQERESLASSIRQAFESSMLTVSEQGAKRLELEVGQRLKLAQDVVAAFKRLRDEIAQGFQRSAESQDQVERTLSSLETILRAEIKARIQSTDGHEHRIAALEHRTANDSQVLAQGLRDLDDQTTQAITQLRGTMDTEYREAMEKVATRVRELQTSLVGTNGMVQELQASMDGVTNQVAQLKAGPSSHQTTAGTMPREDVHDYVQREIAQATQKLQTLVASEVASLHSAFSNSDRSNKEEHQDIRRCLDQHRTAQAEACDELYQEVRVALEAAGAERRALAGQLEQGLEGERKQWEEALNELQVEVARRVKEVKEQLREVQCDALSAKAATGGEMYKSVEAHVARCLSDGSGKQTDQMSEGDGRLREAVAKLEKEVRELLLQQEQRHVANNDLQRADEGDADRNVAVHRIGEQIAALEAKVAKVEKTCAAVSVVDSLQAKVARLESSLPASDISDYTRGLQRRLDDLDDQLRSLRRSFDEETRRLWQDIQKGGCGGVDHEQAVGQRLGALSGQVAEMVERVMRLELAMATASEMFGETEAATKELRKLLESQVRDCRLALELLERKVTDTVCSTSETVGVDRDEMHEAIRCEKEAWQADTERISQGLQEEARVRGKEVSRLEQMIAQLEHLTTKLRDGQVRERKQVEAELKLYVDERFDQAFSSRIDDQEDVGTWS